LTVPESAATGAAAAVPSAFEATAGADEVGAPEALGLAESALEEELEEQPVSTRALTATAAPSKVQNFTIVLSAFLR
jgi:hypothetical protein